MMNQSKITIPADVPKNKHATFLKNFKAITQNTGNLMLFAGDQRVEHLNTDFFGKGIACEDAKPDHLFNIASKAKIGCFATQYGHITRYGPKYKNINYLVKINSKTNLVKTEQMDPRSLAWVTVDQIVNLAKTSKLKIPAVGYTIYIGSEYEAEMLHEASQVITQAHKHGLVTVLWIYPRGAAVKHEKDPHIIAGACDVGSALGSDFVKVNFPQGKTEVEAINHFKEAIQAAGTTKVVCAGGETTSEHHFLELLEKQIAAGASGNATGRNIHQKSLQEAIAFCDAIANVTTKKMTAKQAYQQYQKQK
jgi:fructose-bisphosphate aldolase/6-deoxy-5-ketofructose 1-phosphate synthase